MAYVSRYEKHDLRRRAYAIVKLEEDEPRRFLSAFFAWSESPAEWSERRAKALRFDSKDKAIGVLARIRGPRARSQSPYRIVPIEPVKPEGDPTP